VNEVNAQQKKPPREGNSEQSSTGLKDGTGGKRRRGHLHTLVAQKGKATITRWEKEIKSKREGKAWDALTQEADWVTNPGATQPKETLYHKMMEMAWLTKMMIDKVSSKREDARLEDKKEHKKLLNEILSHLSSLKTITKLLAQVKKDQKARMKQLAAQFHLYLCYIHHVSRWKWSTNTY
jgi:hypothetical protein